MEIDNIFFDMDGVLADFNGGVFEFTNFDGEIDKDQKNSDEIFGKLKDVPHFYFKLKPFGDMIDLFKQVHAKYGSKCQILTGIPKANRGMPTSSDDKRLWVKKYIGENVIVNIVYREEKKNFCKGKSSILIDDLAENINDWNKCGGTGILHVDAKSTENILQKIGVIDEMKSMR